MSIVNRSAFGTSYMSAHYVHVLYICILEHDGQEMGESPADSRTRLVRPDSCLCRRVKIGQIAVVVGDVGSNPLVDFSRLFVIG